MYVVKSRQIFVQQVPVEWVDLIAQRIIEKRNAVVRYIDHIVILRFDPFQPLQ